MIIFHSDSSSIELLPNRSISWQKMCWVIAALGSVSLSIALFWALQGAWIIFPFAGLEIGLLAYLSLRVCSNAYNKQVIQLQANGNIHIEWGYLYPKKQWDFDSRHSEFIIQRARHSLSPDRVAIHDTSGQYLPLGEALNKTDTDQLIQWIRRSDVAYKIKGRTKVQALDEQEIFR